jgi:ketosteroid isomerase-like protein
MRLIWLAVVIAACAVGDRAGLLAADRAAGRAADFLSPFADDATYLYPGAPLVTGKDAIRTLAPPALTWTPAFADVSDDGTLGYTFGWTQQGDQQGKYLACWRKTEGVWRIRAYARSPLGAPVASGAVDSTSPAPVRGRADSRELVAADSAFSAMSVARGARVAFAAFAADEAVTLGGPGAPMNQGREAIAAAFASFPADAVLEWKPLTADIPGSGDLGCTVGEATVRGGERRSYSKYLTIWKRQPDGAWKFVMDGGNARPAP